MSHREECHSLIEQFNDSQLVNVIGLLRSAKTLADDSADDAYCLRLYADYQTGTEKNEPQSLADFAKGLGVSLQ